MEPSGKMDMTKCGVTSSRPFDQKEKIRCMFCRGSSCNRCGITAYLTQANPALDKLHSSWIDDNILAMQRPNDSLFKESNLIEQFKDNNIVAVFNLTEPGEHPYCGHGNLKTSGFPYQPELLMAAGIKHFNYAWPDMTSPSIALMKDIVSVACHEISSGGKIAVHCHAGFGRTGIAIASILIALKGTSSKETIALIRERRPGSVQTQKQKQFVIEFERHHWEALKVFSMPIIPLITSEIDFTRSRAESRSDSRVYTMFDVSTSESVTTSMRKAALEFISPSETPYQFQSQSNSMRNQSIDSQQSNLNSLPGLPQNLNSNHMNNLRELANMKELPSISSLSAISNDRYYDNYYKENNVNAINTMNNMNNINFSNNINKLHNESRDAREGREMREGRVGRDSVGHIDFHNTRGDRSSVSHDIIRSRSEEHSKPVSLFTESPTITRKKEQNLRKYSYANVGSLKSIAQSIRDQQYTLSIKEHSSPIKPIKERSSSSPNIGLENFGNPYKNGNTDLKNTEISRGELLWNHKLIILCINALKEYASSCSETNNNGDNNDDGDDNGISNDSNDENKNRRNSINSSNSSNNDDNNDTISDERTYYCDISTVSTAMTGLSGTNGTQLFINKDGSEGIDEMGNSGIGINGVIHEEGNNSTHTGINDGINNSMNNGINNGMNGINNGISNHSDDANNGVSDSIALSIHNAFSLFNSLNSNIDSNDTSTITSVRQKGSNLDTVAEMVGTNGRLFMNKYGDGKNEGNEGKGGNEEKEGNIESNMNLTDKMGVMNGDKVEFNTMSLSGRISGTSSVRIKSRNSKRLSGISSEKHSGRISGKNSMRLPGDKNNQSEKSGQISRKSLNNINDNIRNNLNIINNNINNNRNKSINSIENIINDNVINILNTIKNTDLNMTFDIFNSFITNIKMEINRNDWDSYHSITKIIYTHSGHNNNKNKNTKINKNNKNNKNNHSSYDSETAESDERKLNEYNQNESSRNMSSLDNLEYEYGRSTPIVSKNDERNEKNENDYETEKNEKKRIENMELNDAIFVISRLFFDFLDSRSDSIFDEILIEKFMNLWNGKRLNQVEIELNYDENDYEINSRAGSSWKKIQNEGKIGKDGIEGGKEGKEGRSFDENSDIHRINSDNKEDEKKRLSLYAQLNKMIENHRVERAKLSLIQQLVDLLKKYRSVIPFCYSCRTGYSSTVPSFPSSTFPSASQFPSSFPSFSIPSFSPSSTLPYPSSSFLSSSPVLDCLLSNSDDINNDNINYNNNIITNDNIINSNKNNSYNDYSSMKTENQNERIVYSYDDYSSMKTETENENRQDILTIESNTTDTNKNTNKTNKMDSSTSLLDAATTLLHNNMGNTTSNTTENNSDISGNNSGNIPLNNPAKMYTENDENSPQSKAYKLILLRIAISSSIHLRESKLYLTTNIDPNCRCTKNIPAALAENILSVFRLNDFDDEIKMDFQTDLQTDFKSVISPISPVISTIITPVISPVFDTTPTSSSGARTDDTGMNNANENNIQNEIKNALNNEIKNNVKNNVKNEVKDVNMIDDNIKYSVDDDIDDGASFTNNMNNYNNNNNNNKYSSTNTNNNSRSGSITTNRNNFNILNNTPLSDETLSLLAIMKTLHLLAINTWNHNDILPNRLRVSRTSVPTIPYNILNNRK